MSSESFSALSGRNAKQGLGKVTVILIPMRRLVRMLGPLLVFLVLTACSTEKKEARGFGKMLQQQSAALDSANTKEKEVMLNLGQWSGRIAFMGPAREDQGVGGRFLAEVEQVKRSLDGITKAIEAEQLKTAYLQTVRSGIVDGLKKRSESLAALNQPLTSANQSIVGFSMSVPRSISEIKLKASTYAPPENTISKALVEIRTKYELTDADLK